MVVGSPLRSMSAWMLGQRHRVPGARGWLWAQFHVIEALALARMLSRSRARHVHSHFANSGATVAMLAAHCLNLPWSLTLHGISETDAPAGALLPGKLMRARFVACASWFMRAQAMRMSPPDMWPKLHVVRCGVDIRHLPTISPETDGRIHFVTVGRLSAEKGYPGLLQAFKTIVTNGLDAQLTIVGDGPLRAVIEGMISSAALEDRVTLTGGLSEDQTLAQIAKADIFVLASLMEGLPVVLMEAMSMERPVIAPAVAGIPELVSHRTSGLLFRASDWEQLGDCMQTLASDPQMRETLGRVGRTRIEEEFDIDAAVAPLEALFLSTLQRDEES
jgi:glycosyltransferase involved in cell wall biosynthesis